VVDVEEEPEENIQRKNDDDYINLYTINIMSGYETPTDQNITRATPQALVAALEATRAKAKEAAQYDKQLRTEARKGEAGGRRRRRRSSKRRKSRKSKRKRKRRSTKKKRRRRRRR
jgi:hypothetical protein